MNRNRFNFQAINDQLPAEELIRDLAPGGKREGQNWTAKNPTRSGDSKAGSFSVNLKNGKWADFATGDKGGDLISLYAYVKGIRDQVEAAKELAQKYGISLDAEALQKAASNIASIKEKQPTPVFPVPAGTQQPSFNHPKFGAPSKVWTYQDAKGRVLLHIVRFDPKDMRKQILPRSWCLHPNGESKWTWRGITGPGARPIYGLQRLAEMPEADVVMVEGEKAADAGQDLLDQAAVVISWMGGVETADKVSVAPLKGRRVILFPDFDSKHYPDTHARAGELMDKHEQPGVRAMLAIAQKLKGVAREIIMVDYVPADAGGTLPDTWDLADAAAMGWDGLKVLDYIGQNARDPLSIARGDRGKPQDVQPAPGEGIGTQAPAPRPAPSTVANVALDASVNPFGFPHLSDKGQPMNTVENLDYLMTEYGITAKYNQVRKQIEVTLPGREYTVDNRSNCTLAELSSICSRNRMPKAELQDYVKLIADRNSYNPVRDWIASKPWDGVSRKRQFFDSLIVTGNPEMRDLLVQRWMVSGVAAAFKDSGFRSRGVLVLLGPQGSGKTSWLRALIPGELNAFLDGAVLDPANKDMVKNVVSHFIVELGELDATFRKADIARLKGWVTLPSDKLRLPYDRIESEYPRRTVMSASVNEGLYLVDDTGNSRWWTVAVSKCNFRHGIDMQQLWAEFLVDFKNGMQWWLTDEEEALLSARNVEHEAVDPVEEMMLRAFDWESDSPRTNEMTATEVLLALGFDKPQKAQATHCSSLLRKLTGKEPKKKANGRFFALPRRSRRNEESNGPF